MMVTHNFFYSQPKMRNRGLAFSTNTGRVHFHGLGDLRLLCSLAGSLEDKGTETLFNHENSLGH